MEFVGHIMTALSPANVRSRRIDKLMFKPAEVPNWVVLIYERRQRFREEVARRMVTELVKACEAVGKAIQTSSTGSSRN
jgi:hypothetical protein